MPSLLLMVDFPRGGYPQGQLLSIPRFRLHQAARLLAAQDPAFRVRLAMLEIDRHDVERMIQLATYGLIKPQLSDDWLSSPFVFSDSIALYLSVFVNISSNGKLMENNMSEVPMQHLSSCVPICALFEKPSS